MLGACPFAQHSLSINTLCFPPALLPTHQVLTLLSQAQREQQQKEHVEKLKAKQRAATHKVWSIWGGDCNSACCRRSWLPPCHVPVLLPLDGSNCCFLPAYPLATFASTLPSLPPPCSPHSLHCRCGPLAVTSVRRSRMRR